MRAGGACKPGRLFWTSQACRTFRRAPFIGRCAERIPKESLLFRQIVTEIVLLIIRSHFQPKKASRQNWSKDTTFHLSHRRGGRWGLEEMTLRPHHRDCPRAARFAPQVKAA